MDFLKTDSFRLKVLLLAVSMILFDGCKTVDKLTHFNMDYDETITIPSTVGINLPFNLITPNIKTNSEETFQINDTHKDLIEEIVLKELTLNIVSPVGADFSFLKSIEVYISADGLDEIKVAWKYDIDNDVGASIQLETVGDDLKEYIKKDEFDLKLTTVTDELILSNHDIEVKSKFFVDAKILGI